MKKGNGNKDPVVTKLKGTERNIPHEKNSKKQKQNNYYDLSRT